jgi:hypothetical protein
MEKIPGERVSCTKDGITRSKFLFDFTDLDVHGFVALGPATGTSLAHCISLGTSHEIYFFDRIVGFRFLKNHEQTVTLKKLTGQDYMTIEFFVYK